ncbi:MAG TPA: hypothetical protein VHQ66_07450 [Myxococcota bacterium]|nr:hypothetical protein [Myxococcota bacterium]
MKLFVRDVAQASPRREPNVEKRLRPPEVPNPGDQPLVEQRLADLPVLVAGAYAPHHLVEVRRVAHDIRPEARDGARGELEHRSVPLDSFESLAAEDEPWLPEDARPRLLDVPATSHAQVAAQDDAALEGEQEVFPDRLDVLEPPAVDPFGHAENGCARMGRLGADHVPFEDAETIRRAVESVSFRHGERHAAGRRRIPLRARAA